MDKETLVRQQPPIRQPDELREFDTHLLAALLSAIGDQGGYYVEFLTDVYLLGKEAMGYDDRTLFAPAGRRGKGISKEMLERKVLLKRNGGAVVEHPDGDAGAKGEAETPEDPAE